MHVFHSDCYTDDVVTLIWPVKHEKDIFVSHIIWHAATNLDVTDFRPSSRRITHNISEIAFYDLMPFLARHIKSS